MDPKSTTRDFIETEIKHCERDIRDLQSQYEAENKAWQDTKDQAEHAYQAAMKIFTEQGLTEKEAEKEAAAFYDGLMNSFDTKRLQIIEGHLDYTRELLEAMKLALIGWNTVNKQNDSAS